MNKNEVKALLLPGDVLLFRKKHSFSLIPRIISWIQGNEHVHVGIVTEIYPIVMVAEADSDYGIRHVAFEVSALQEIPCVVRLNEPIDPEALKMAVARVYPMGSYAFEKIVDAMINHAMGRIFGWFGKPFTYRVWFGKNLYESRFICSTLVSHLLSKCSNHKYNPTAEPDDFTKAEWTEVYHHEA